MNYSCPKCNEPEPCFAQRQNPTGLRCTILTRAYPKPGTCPFCKPEADVTDGQRYPMRRGMI